MGKQMVGDRQYGRAEGARSVVLVSCAAKKRAYRAKAQDLYASPLFNRQLAYARALVPDAIYILSAKYGLVDLDMELEPYDLTLNNLSSREVRDWAARVLGQLAQKADLHSDKFVFLAGHAYRRFLVQNIHHWEAPLANLRIGEQLQRLDELLHG
jgi:hypothetical protein